MSAMRAGAAVALLLLVSDAEAVDVLGAVGGGYTRSDTATQAGPAEGAPFWNLLGNVAVSGSPLHPGVLQLEGGAAYDLNRNMYSAAPTHSTDWSFHGSSLLFSASGLPVHLSASRGQSDFTTEGAAPATGSTTATTYGGGFSWGGDAVPALSADVSHSDRDNTSFGAATSHETTTAYRASASQTQKTFSYALSYDGSSNEGTFDSQNYRLHNFLLSGNAAVTRDVEARVVSRYTLREPTVSSALNPRFDTQSLEAGLTFDKQSKLMQQVVYNYGHDRAALPASFDDQVLQSGTYLATWNYSETLQYTGSLGVSTAVQQTNAVEQRTTGEQMGLGFSWRLPLDTITFALDGGGSLGLLQMPGVSSKPGYGAYGGLTVTPSLGRIQTSASYRVSYNRDLGALPGHSLQHTAQLMLSSAWGKTALRGSLQGNYATRDTPLFGSSTNKSILASAGASKGPLGLDVSAGASDGLAQTLTVDPTTAVLLSQSFNSRSVFATVAGSAQLLRSLALTLTASTVDTTSPDRPHSYQRGLAGTLTWRIGLFSLQVQDVLSYGGTGGGDWVRGNLLMVRALRSFGAKF